MGGHQAVEASRLWLSALQVLGANDAATQVEKDMCAHINSGHSSYYGCSSATLLLSLIQTPRIAFYQLDMEEDRGIQLIQLWITKLYACRDSILLLSLLQTQ
jgi:hypothetical protein